MNNQLKHIREVISDYTGIKEDRFLTRRRDKSFVISRQLYAVYVKDYFKLTVEETSLLTGIERVHIYHYMKQFRKDYSCDYDPLTRRRGFKETSDKHIREINN